MKSFREGQKIICVDVHEIQFDEKDSLTIGRVYRVLATTTNDSDTVYVCDNYGKERGYYLDRFKVWEDPKKRKEKLEKLYAKLQGE